jgi:SAM-dependent methyltransferase
MMAGSAEDHGVSTADARWLAATWPFVREHLPAPPSRVLEIGCGPLGGFVPALQADGYDALGIDPEAPEGSGYERAVFERHELARPVDAVVACTSLHHVADLPDVVGKIGSSLVPGGMLVVVEWAWERFDETTARWCFDRLAAGHADHHESGWLHHHRDGWAASGQEWERYFGTWAQHERLHTGQEIVRELEARFDTQLHVEGPYVFADLGTITATEEQAAIDAGQIQPTGIFYVGEPRADSMPGRPR